jgi:RNA polymerase sigma factor (sigma-70 family)
LKPERRYGLSNAVDERVDAIVERIRTGDASAWAGVDREARAWLAALVARRLPRGIMGAADAEDVVQSTLLRALQELARNDSRPVRNARHWLEMLARWTVVDQIRRESLRRGEERAGEWCVASNDAVDSSSMAEPEDPCAERDYAAVELRLDLATRLRELPAQEAEVLWMRLARRGSRPLVARSLGLTIAQVRALEGTARERLVKKYPWNETVRRRARRLRLSARAAPPGSRAGRRAGRR